MYPTSIPDLVTKLHPQSPPPTRLETIEAGYRRDLDLIETALTSTNGSVRAAALSASLRAGNLTSSVLTSYLTDRSSAVRRRAVELSPRVNPTKNLVRGLCDRILDTDQIAEIAAFSLGEIGEHHTELVTSEVTDLLSTTVSDHPDALCREAAVASLGALGQRLDVILAALGDKATVRRRAVIALAPFEGPEVEAALTRALEDRDWQVRQAAEDLLS